MKPHEMRAKAKDLKAEAQKIYEAAKNAEDGMSDDDAKRYSALLDQAETHMKDAAAEEARWNRLQAMEEQLRAAPKNNGRLPVEGTEDLPHNDEKNTRKELHQYSICKALVQMCKGIDHVDGLEREVHEELKKHKYKPARGLLIPWDLPARVDGRPDRFSQRALDTTAGVGAIPTILSPNLIDFLRARLVTASMGATILTGMTGLFAIPRQSGTGTGYWLPEAGPATASNQTIDQVPFSPKTAGAFTDYTRRFMEEASLSAEQFVRDDLTNVIARTVELAAINGSGSSNQPRGILNVPGIPAVEIGTNGGNPTWGTIVDLETAVAAVNADLGNLGYVTNALVRGWLKQAPKEPGFPIYIWNADSDLPLNGYSCGVSNMVPSNLTAGTGTGLSALIYGNWSDLVFAFWSGMDVLVDPYTGGTAGTVRIVVLQDVDVNVRHPESFSKCVQIQTS